MDSMDSTVTISHTCLTNIHALSRLNLPKFILWPLEGSRKGLVTELANLANCCHKLPTFTWWQWCFWGSGVYSSNVCCSGSLLNPEGNATYSTYCHLWPSALLLQC